MLETGMKLADPKKISIAEKKNGNARRFLKQTLLCLGGKTGAWLIVLLALWLVVTLWAA